ncbi:MAG: hypothetical protein WCY27_03775 [archaeon]|jgi:hypothetical protein|nr:hypothetical protein [archaeon]MDD2477776.1 hypothetical protein [Candidatus ainarchaeum sp.]MDD3084852.1 hypothetical protein [Candidatus ainarchaeum sp.]MDD4221186.1 hypothetical protein [Candidatus ainarchaeum sp.]MDD4662862.1 hypothetical protein [Candidatus ainarchaeum sp.]
MNLFKIIKNIFSKKDINKENIETENINKKEDQIHNLETNTKIETIDNFKNTNILENNNYSKSNISETKIKTLQPQLNYENTKIKEVTVQELTNELNTIWDLIKIKENTQAEHIIKSLPSDKWTTMDELRQNIKLEFNIEYKNEKSLYPYLKTLTDIHLIKINNTGKKRTWKKNIIIIKDKN